MREWICRAVFLLALSVLACTSAWAQPSPITSTVPNCVMLVGTNGFVPDPAGQVTVVVRDANSNVMPNVGVIFDLINVPDIEICPNQPAGQTATCAPGVRRVCRVTDAFGVANFIVYGKSVGPAIAQSALGEIWANSTASCVLGGGSVQLTTVSVSAIDLDGVGGVGANDLSVWLADFSTGDPWTRSDYDCTGNVGANDFSIWLTLFGLGGSGVTCAVGC